MTKQRRQNHPEPRLKNIGPKSMKWLREIGIHSREDLEKVGAVMAYLILKQRRPEVSLNMLYAMSGALSDRHWNEFSKEEKLQLQAEAEGELVIQISKPT